MESPVHDLTHLFAQLGLPSDPPGIEGFIASHGPLPSAMQLFEAPFWTPGQADFLREGTLVDADWSDAIDALNQELCGHRH